MIWAEQRVRLWNLQAEAASSPQAPMAPEAWTELATAVDICWLCPTSVFPPLLLRATPRDPLKDPKGSSLSFLSLVCFEVGLMPLLLGPPCTPHPGKGMWLKYGH